MRSTELRQLIRESINEYIREIDDAGNKAALEAKMTATQEAIDLREKKMNMDGLDEAYHDMLDKGKVKELSGEVKALEKSLTKLKKQLDKLNSKSEPKTEVKDEVIDEVDKYNPENNWNDAEVDDPFNAGQTKHQPMDEARFEKGTDIGKKGKGFAKDENDKTLFNVIICNPPFQIAQQGERKGAHGNKTLWDKFIIKSFTLLKDNGFLAFINPSSWRRPENKLYNLMTKQNQLIYLHIFGYVLVKYDNYCSTFTGYN
jgi:hypothetical protein